MPDEIQTEPPEFPFPWMPLQVGNVEIVGWDGFSYVDRSGRTYWSGAEPSEVDCADAVQNPRPCPAPVVIMTPLTVLSRLTPAEEMALTASADLAVSIVRQRMIAAGEIRSDDPRTIEGRQILIAKGIITAERAAEIFA